MTNKERRQAGLGYKTDDEILIEQKEAQATLKKINALDTTDHKGIEKLLRTFFGSVGKNCNLNLPFICEYGYNISVGDDFYSNFDLVILDGAPVKIGDRVQIAPGVHIYTAGHPVHSATRATGVEYCKSVCIGNDVWLGGRVVVCPGVKIGDGVVIGAGSVVTKDIPPNVLAAGNPCRVIRPITNDDRGKLFKGEEIDPDLKKEFNI